MGDLMSFNEKVLFGKTGRYVGKLGISSSYGAKAKDFEIAFDYGCNYFNWGTFIKGRSGEMKKAIKNIISNGKRDGLFLGMLTYAHNSLLTDFFFKRGLKALGTEYADLLILGYYSDRPPQKIIDHALKLKEQGLVRFLGLTSHNRLIFPELAKENIFDVFHIRYNAVHRGAVEDCFPYIEKENKPGIVSFTATSWGQLLKSSQIPEGIKKPEASDCYRYVLSNADVDLCMMGARNSKQMAENLKVLEMAAMSEDELRWMEEVGDYIYGRK